MRNILFFLSLTSCVAAHQIQAADTQHIKGMMASHRYHDLGKYGKQHIGKECSLSEIAGIAREIQDESVQKAVDSTRNYMKMRPDWLSMSSGSYFQIALFFETEVNQGQHKGYLKKSQTGLEYDVECDAEFQSQFIVAKDKSAYLGEGKKKIVTKALMYGKYPKVVARAEQSMNMDREMDITKKMHDKEGIFRTYGFGKHRDGGKKSSTIYAHLYRPGSFQTIFEKKMKFSTREKVEMALNVLKGLRSLHQEGYAHCDLGARNYLVDVKKHGGHRTVEATIADLGRANTISELNDSKVQGNTTYTAPEGLFRSKMKGADYLKADVFAVGCVFYWLCYEKRAPWQDRSFVKDESTPLKERYKVMTSKIEKATKERREYLESKKNHGVTLSQKEAFEAVILNMLETNPKKRVPAEKLVQEMEKVRSNNHVSGKKPKKIAKLIPKAPQKKHYSLVCF